MLSNSKSLIPVPIPVPLPQGQGLVALDTLNYIRIKLVKVCLQMYIRLTPAQEMRSAGSV